MKEKQKYFTTASFFALIFVLLGYLVSFYPETLVGFDRTIHTLVRGDLPDGLTNFFKAITTIGNTRVQVALAVVAVVVLLLKKWYAESLFVAGNALLAAFAILSLKNIYQRPRPSIEHLVHADGYSFPSGHSLGTMLIIGSLIVICYQRIHQKWLRNTVTSLLALLIFLVGLSRIYHGVHYPTDVIAGFSLGLALILVTYPFYANKRFQWRFHSKQK